VTRRDEIRQRLGRYARWGSGYEVDHLMRVTEGKPLIAVFVAMWRWRGWLGAATDDQLLLIRKPKVFGRRKERAWRWADLRHVRASGTLDVEFDFAGERVELRLISRPEYGALLDHARGPAATSLAELRELARRKLGRFFAYGEQATIDALPDHLRPGERVERIALAKLDFPGVLAVTDRRLLLLRVTRGSTRLWELPREDVHTLEVAEPNRLTLATPDGVVTLTEILPVERRDELAAVLR
jgi:hypothetical protein